MHRLAFGPLAVSALLVLHAALPAYSAETQSARIRGQARAGAETPTVSTATTSSVGGSTRALWLADYLGLVKLDPAAPETWLEPNDPTTDPWDLYAIAADHERQVIWGAGWASVSSSAELRAYRFDGTPLRVIALPLAQTFGVRLRLQPDDGSVWVSGLATTWRVWHVDALGQVRLEFAPVDTARIVLLEVDAGRGRVWVGTSTTLRAYSTATGQVLQTIDLALPTEKVKGQLEYTSFLRAGVVEPDTGHLWLTLDHVLRRYDPTGALVLEASLPSKAAWDRGPVLDEAGGVWLGSGFRILRYDRTGQLLVDIPQLFPATINELTAIATDVLDDSIWAGSTGWYRPYGYRQFSATGTGLLERDWFLEIRDLAVTLDAAPPALIFTAPAQGAALRTGQPALEIAYTSPGAGIDPATLTFTANGASLAVTCAHTETGSSCTPDAPLADGAYTVVATVADLSGTRSEPAEVAFGIDTVVPGLVVTAPADGLVTNVAQVVVTGEVDEAVTVTIRLDGAAVESFPLPSAASFDSSPLTLAEGANLVEVLALDAAGNQAQQAVTVTLDTVPPAAPGAGTIVVGDVTGGQVTVSGLAGSVEPGLTVTIENLRTGETVTVVAHEDGSFTATLAAQEGDTFAISAADAAGNTGPATETTVGAPRGTYVDALWVSTSEAFLKVAALDGAVLAEVAEPAGLRAAAVDALRSVVWAYRPGTLLTYDLTGTPLGSLALPLPPDYTEATPVRLIPGPAGGVWLAVGDTVRRVDAQRTVRVTSTLAEPIVALTWPGVSGRLWVATPTAVTAYQEVPIDRQTSRLDPVATLDLGGLAPSDLVVDPASGSLWVALEGRVRRYDATGAVVAEAMYAGTGARLALDGQGGVWVAAETEVLRLDGAGAVQALLSPWPGLEPPLAVVGQPRDGSAWVAGATTLTEIDDSGQVRRALALRAPLEARDLALYADLFAPSVTLVAPATGTVSPTNRPAIEVAYSDGGSGVAPETLAVTANGEALDLTCSTMTSSATCTLATGLPEGVVTLRATVEDRAGNASAAAEGTFTVDTIAPALTLTAPAEGLLTNVPSQTVTGQVSERVTLEVALNGSVVDTRTIDGGPFSLAVTLTEGANALVATARDAAGHEASRTRSLTLDTIPPAAVTSGAVVIGEVVDGAVTVTGAAGSVEAGAQVTITNRRTGEVVVVVAGADGSFTAQIAALSLDELALVVRDTVGNTSDETRVETPITIPPDPATVAPPLDLTAATDLAPATAFLYTGATPIQQGVAPGTIEARRVAVLRGVVRSRDGSALSGVQVRILGRPEFGQTFTRADGGFDLAVNGGGVLTVEYARAGYLSVQRQVTVPWRDFAWLPDVVLTALDPEVTVVDLASATTIAVAQGSPVTDTDGTRQATLLFTPGTAATMVLPDGTEQALTALSVRATEYTAGPTGRAAMPAELPPTSGYTYAVELSVDEALAAGATSVRFSQPVVNYVENFLGFPTGMAVPTGYYDRRRAAWVPAPNGRVVQIVGVTDGRADLDVTGAGVPSAAADLAALGVTDEERTRLAGLYAPGQSLWRVPVTHFTPWDHNWPYGPPDGATAPSQPPAEADGTLDTENCDLCPRSTIEVQNQVLGESIAMAGTPFRLHYRSDRVPGRVVANRVRIPLSGATVPASLERIILEASVAGQVFRGDRPASPNQVYELTWDGRDGYGRPVQGSQPVKARIGYVYRAVYREPAALETSFGALGGAPISGVRGRDEIIVWQESPADLFVGAWDARAQGLGGWTLDVHHAYDPAAGVIHLGDGSRRSARDVSRVISRAAGTGAEGSTGDGGPATEAAVTPWDVAVAPDGSVYVTDADWNTVRRIDPEGIITTIAGNGTAAYGGDGGPATEASLFAPEGLAVGPDGSLIVADQYNSRIRRIWPDGTITTVAGVGNAGSGHGFTGDGGPATEARLYWPSDVAVAPDGTLYIADTWNHRIRRVGPDGIIATIAGSATPQNSGGYGGDGGPATAAVLDLPVAVALGPEGDLYIADQRNHRIRRVTPDGLIETFAGDGTSGAGGDGSAATIAQLSNPRDVMVGPGGVYIADGGLNRRIRHVAPGGVIRAFAGSGGFDTGLADGTPALQASVSATRLDVAPDGRLYATEPHVGARRLREIGRPLPSYRATDHAIPSEDGREVYVFDGRGRHLRTVDALTGVVLYGFEYDDSGRLVAVRDRDGLVTQVERDAAGAPTAIVAPGGQRTALGLDLNGFLASVTNPALETVQLTYSANGLLATITDARQGLHRYTYHPLSYLIRDEDPAGGFAALGRTEGTGSTTVSYQTGEGRVSSHRVERPSTGGSLIRTTDPSGLASVLRVDEDGRRTATSPDGTVSEVLEGPDPRFGMQAPVATQQTVRLPSGLTATMTRSRSVVLDDPGNPLSLRTQTETTVVNGRTYTSTYDALTRTLVTRTPAGRETVTILDALGRVAEVRAPGLAPVTLTYDARGRLATVTEGTGADARVTTMSYDAQDRLVGILDAENRPVAFTYDAADRVLTQTLPDNRVIAFAYDANGNVTAVTPPERPAHAFEYTPVDLEARYDPPVLPEGPTPTTRTYNTDKQPTLVTRPDAQTINLGYDTGGRLETLVQPRGTTNLTYSPATGQLIRVTAPDGGTLSYTYDGGLLTIVTWGAGPITGSVVWTYDNDFRVASESVNGQAVSFGYDADSLLTQAGALALTRDAQTGFLTGTTLGVVTDSRTYTSFGEPETYEAQVSGAPVYAVTYTRNALGHITEKTETIEGVTTVTGYRYDVAGRLDQVTIDGVVTATYTYDANGNRLTKTTPGGTDEGTYDAQDRLLSYAGATYTYTANGERQTKTDAAGTTTYTYDLTGNLTAVQLPDGRLIAYVIDGQNRRIGKKVDGVLVQGWLYRDQLKPVAEVDGTGQVVARFVFGSNPLVPDYVIKGGATYRVITDHLGSPRLVVDTATGIVIQRRDYDAWGRITLDTNPGFQPFGFAGGLEDPDTKFVRFGLRDYDPAIGRWTAKDPVGFGGQDPNLYGYVATDAVNYVDPVGLWTLGIGTTVTGSIKPFGGGGGLFVNVGHDPGAGWLSGWSFSITGTAAAGAVAGYGFSPAVSLVFSDACDVSGLLGPANEIGRGGIGRAGVGGFRSLDGRVTGGVVGLSLPQYSGGYLAGYAGRSTTSALFQWRQDKDISLGASSNGALAVFK